MRINHNIASLNAYRQLSANNALSQKSLEKLSSGLRINRAGDDAAGLAISEKMRGQIRGLEQASRNAQDSISLLQTAEGALNETHSILQRMRELAVQSSNDTNNANDRQEIQKEISQLISEIDRIGNNTEFNTKVLLNGGAGIQGSTSKSWALILGGSENVKLGTIRFDDLKASQVGTVTFEARVTTDGSDAAFTEFNDGTFSINGTSIAVTATDTIDTFLDKINSVSAETGVSASGTLAAGITFTTANTGTSARIDISGFNNVVAMNAEHELQANKNGAGLADSSGTESVTGLDASLALDAAGTTGVNATGYTASGNIITFVGGDYDGLMIKVNAEADGSVDNITATITANNVLSSHIGANQDQTMSISINDMRATALGVNAVDVTTKAGAEQAITTIQTAIDLVSAERSKLGAYQNRLEHTINNLGTSSENLTASESRVRDVDMAKEMMEFTKMNILSQAATAMLAQANQQPQSILQLLGR